MSVKHVLLTSAMGIALAASSAALAGGPDAMGGSHNATFMGGLSAGGGITRNTGYAVVRRAGNKNDNSVEGLGFRAQLDYGQFVKGNFYVGGDANIDFTDAKTQNVIAASTFGVEEKWSGSVSLMPGYRLLRNVLFFGKVGFARAALDVSAGNQSNTEGYNGVVLGVGLAYAIRSKVDVRLEYDYYKLDKESVTINTGGSAQNGDVSPRLETVALTLNYHVNV